jgi:hypothetical protein
LDTSLPSNAKTIARLQKEIFGSSTLEAFLESAPQFILQCSIIWRTGTMGKIANNCPEILTAKGYAGPLQRPYFVLQAVYVVWQIIFLFLYLCLSLLL